MVDQQTGCYNRKGANIPSQPQRMCRIIKVPDIITPTPIMSFAAISAQFAPAEEDNKKDNLPARNYDYQRRGDFDLEQWCAAHGINIVGKAKSADGTRYYLEHCLFNPEHAGKDAVLFRYDNGAIAYKCLHDTCNGFGWKDVRLKYEPNAYDHQEHQDFLYKNLRHLDKSQLRQLPTVQPPAPIQPTEEKGNVWLTMSSVALPSFDIKQYVPSGIEQIDRKIIGFKRKHVTVWSGYRGCGKSSLLNMLILNAADKSYNSALWTGELDCSEVKQWLYLQASGKQYNRPTSVDGYFYTPKNICEHIDPWIDKHFRLFNNEYGSNFTQIIDELRKLKETFDVDVAIFDNLMTLDLTGVPGDKYEQQDRLMVALTALAKELDIHIHIVAHPNKSGGFLRMNSVSGSGHITDLAQNVFIMHRVNKDFMTFAPEFLGADKVGAITSTGCTNCIEICKCRDKGSAVDTFIQLFFEKESNRLKDTEWESVNYGWSNVGQQQLSISAMMQNVNFDQQHGQYADERFDDIRDRGQLEQQRQSCHDQNKQNAFYELEGAGIFQRADDAVEQEGDYGNVDHRPQHVPEAVEREELFYVDHQPAEPVCRQYNHINSPGILRPARAPSEQGNDERRQPVQNSQYHRDRQHDAQYADRGLLCSVFFAFSFDSTCHFPTSFS